MKTLNEYHESIFRPDSCGFGTGKVMAGVLCNKCKIELYYQNPNMVLAYIPPKRTVVCPECHDVSYKIEG